MSRTKVRFSPKGAGRAAPGVPKRIPRIGKARSFDPQHIGQSHGQAAHDRRFWQHILYVDFVTGLPFGWAGGGQCLKSRHLPHRQGARQASLGTEAVSRCAAKTGHSARKTGIRGQFPAKSP